MNPDRREHSLDRRSIWLYAELLLIAAAIVAFAILIWRLSDLLLLVFGAVLVAVLLRSLSKLVSDHTPLGDAASLAVAGVLIAVVLGGFAAVLGTQLQAQMADLAERMPELLRIAEERFGIVDAEEWIRRRTQDFAEDGGLAMSIFGYSSWILGGLANVLLVLVAGIYMAVRPRLYRDGLLILVPRPSRTEAAETLDAVGGALKLWLVGQLAAMILVGTLISVGLWLIGIPSAFALGFIAGLLEFIPFLGPVLSAAPAVAIGLTEGPVTALWVVGLFVLVQQLEGYLITPLVQQRTVELPPALTIFAIVGFAILFGPLGVLFATPLAVVVFVLVKKLWVRDLLQEETDIPGEKEHERG
ncbi:MAG TPA: AI-2E family transporter [Gammaproteobacteria bacterium]